MATRIMSHLWKSLDLKLSEVMQPDFWMGLVAGGACIAVGITAPEALLRGVPIAAGAIGVILGAVIAGVSIQVAFFDQSFLRKLRSIDRDPVRYLSPFFFTVVVGVVAMVALLVLGVMTPTTSSFAVVPVAFVAGFATIWAITSLLPLLATLIQFIRLKHEALDVPDDEVTARRAGQDRSRGVAGRP